MRWCKRGADTCIFFLHRWYIANFFYQLLHTLPPRRYFHLHLPWTCNNLRCICIFDKLSTLLCTPFRFRFRHAPHRLHSFLLQCTPFCIVDAYPTAMPLLGTTCIIIFFAPFFASFFLHRRCKERWEMHWYVVRRMGVKRGVAPHRSSRVAKDGTFTSDRIFDSKDACKNEVIERGAS